MRGRTVAGSIGGALAGLTAYDLLQRRHAILRNYPIAGHLRYVLETFGPELRQYIVTNNDEERPFSRDQRRWIYASSKSELNTFGFGTDLDLEATGSTLIIEHAPFGQAAPADDEPGSGPEYLIPVAKVLGGAHGRRHAFRPSSIVAISGMSYGALSPPAVEAMNRGAALAPCLHNTGEGGISPHHRHGGELIFQIGTGYFGCRDAQGRFSLERLLERMGEGPVRAIEIKLSQGAKPGLGGHLPGVKVDAEIARIRGVPEGEDCISPPRHSAFTDVDTLIAFVERIADATGLPVGIKSAVGQMSFWEQLTARMAETGAGPDFVTIDGGEGGTGAAPLVFADHVSLPFKLGFSRVWPLFARAGIADDVVFVGSGRLGLPDTAMLGLGLGCDMINVGREAMLSVGCIQALRCHTGKCPTGVATQSKWLMGGLDPDLKHARLANYVRALRGELLALARACGVTHPALVGLERMSIVSEPFRRTPAEEVFGYREAWRPSEERRAEIAALVGSGGAHETPGAEAGPIPGDATGQGEEGEMPEHAGHEGLARGGD